MIGPDYQRRQQNRGSCTVGEWLAKNSGCREGGGGGAMGGIVHLEIISIPVYMHRSVDDVVNDQLLKIWIACYTEKRS